MLITHAYSRTLLGGQLNHTYRRVKRGSGKHIHVFPTRVEA